MNVLQHKRYTAIEEVNELHDIEETPHAAKVDCLDC